MGCCCSRANKSAAQQEVELANTSTTTNAAVMCRGGPLGSAVKTTLNSENNFITVQGCGTSLGSCSLDCDTAFWEVRIGQNPVGVKVGVRRFSLKRDAQTVLDDQLTGDDQTSWCFKGEILKTGDVVGICWDQTDLPMLSFTVNGKPVPDASILRVRPSVDIVPAVSVENGSTCEVIFDGNHFLNPPSSKKFKMIVAATSLI